jgi:hypothetical protein
MASEPTITALQVAQVGQQCCAASSSNLSQASKKPLNWSASVRPKAAPLPAYLAP